MEVFSVKLSRAILILTCAVGGATAHAAASECAILPVKVGGSDRLPIHEYGLFVFEDGAAEMVFQDPKFNAVYEKSKELEQSNICNPIPYCRRLPLSYVPGLIYCMAESLFW